MTRRPSLPPMPPAEPLDESERTLARALRNLPTGTPSPELDARILGAARRSVHMATPRRRDRRWLIGLSTAATAVLALGVLLKMHGLGHDTVLAPPAEIETSAALQAAAKQKDAGPEAAADAVAPAGVASGIASPAPAPPQDESRQVREEQPANAAAMPAKESPRAFPATPALQRVLAMPIPPPPPPMVMETTSPMAASTPAPAAPSVDRERSEDKAALSSDARRDSEKDAKSAPAATAAAGGMSGQIAHEPAAASKAESNRTQSNAMQSNAPMQQQKSLDKVTVTGARLKKDTSITLPAPSDDAALNPTEWIERVRERLRSGDRSGAVTSLRKFVHAYPNENVPDDLLPLLR